MKDFIKDVGNTIRDVQTKKLRIAANVLNGIADKIAPQKVGGSSGGGGSTGGGTPTQTTSEPPVTPTANSGGPNYNNDNRGGKQMNVQMGDNLNSSSGNTM